MQETQRTPKRGKGLKVVAAVIAFLVVFLGGTKLLTSMFSKENSEEMQTIAQRLHPGSGWTTLPGQKPTEGKVCIAGASGSCDVISYRWEIPAPYASGEMSQYVKAIGFEPIPDLSSDCDTAFSSDAMDTGCSVTGIVDDWEVSIDLTKSHDSKDKHLVEITVQNPKKH